MVVGGLTVDCRWGLMYHCILVESIIQPRYMGQLIAPTSQRPHTHVHTRTQQAGRSLMPTHTHIQIDRQAHHQCFHTHVHTPTQQAGPLGGVLYRGGRRGEAPGRTVSVVVFVECLPSYGTKTEQGLTLEETLTTRWGRRSGSSFSVISQLHRHTHITRKKGCISG